MNKKFMSIEQFAKKYGISKERVTKLCEKGKIKNAIKDTKGCWKIPIESEYPFLKKEISKSYKQKENIIVAVVTTIIIITTFMFIGFNGIKMWLCSPLFWNDPDYINVSLIQKEEESSQMNLTFLIENNSSELFDGYVFYVSSGSAKLKISGVSNPIPGYSSIEENVSLASNGSASRFYKALSGKDVSDINLTVHVKSLDYNGETVFKNKAWPKNIIILGISILAGILISCDIIRIKWLRLLLKFMSVPALLVLVAVAIFTGVGSKSDGSAREESDTQMRKYASEKYKQAAGWKAGAEMNGNKIEAARAQRTMDQAMADMISTNNSQAAKKYKQAAGWKAGAEMNGNKVEAARAQRTMDRALADMLNEKNKN